MEIKTVKPVTDEEIFYDKFSYDKFYLLVCIGNFNLPIFTKGKKGKGKGAGNGWGFDKKIKNWVKCPLVGHSKIIKCFKTDGPRG